MTLPLLLAMEQDYPSFAHYLLLSTIVGWADDVNFTVGHAPHKPHTPDTEPTVTQQADDLLGLDISSLSRNNVIVHPTKSMALIKLVVGVLILAHRGPP